MSPPDCILRLPRRRIPFIKEEDEDDGGQRRRASLLEGDQTRVKWDNFPECKLPLDKIEVAGSITTAAIDKLLGDQLFAGCEWAARTRRVMTATSLDDFCGFIYPTLEELAKQRNRLNTRRQFLKQVEQLDLWNVVDPTDASGHCVAVTYFCVAKGDSDVGRAITSCRYLNSLCDNSPHFRLATTTRIFEILSQFTKPWIACEDYRHYFYQISLPQVARHLFTIIIGDQAFQLRDLPMGFSWSPNIAQSITCAMIYKARALWREAMIKCGTPESALEQPSIPSKAVEDAIHFQIRGKTRITMLAIYDNVMIVADNDINRRRAMEAMNQVQKEVGVVMKHNESSLPLPAGWEMYPSTRAFGEDHPKATTLVDELYGEYFTFLGIDYTVGNTEGKEQVIWRHTRKNVQRWEKSRKQIIAPLLCNEVAEVIGILQWDIRCSGIPLSALSLPLSILAKVGRSLHADNLKWTDRCTLDDRETETLLKAYDVMLQRVAAPHFSKRPLPSYKFEDKVFIAVDASKFAGAAVELTPDGPRLLFEPIKWTPEQAKRGINWRETYIAIMAVEAVIERFPPERVDHIGIFMAEDNTTALAAMNSLYYSKSEYLCGRILDMHSQLRTGQVLAFYEHTSTQPADFPSRKEWEETMRAMMSVGDTQAKRIANTKYSAWIAKCCDCYFRLNEQVEEMLSRRKLGESGRKRNRE